MPLTFPPIAIEQAVAGSITTYTRRVDIYQANGTTLWLGDVPIVSGSVDITYGQNERRTADLTLWNEAGALDINRNGGLWYDKVVKITMGVDAASPWETPLGLFLIDRISTRYGSAEVSLTLRDFTKKLMLSRFPFDTAWPRHAPLENILSDIAGAGGIDSSRRNFPLTGVTVDVGKDLVLTQGTERWTAMADLAASHNYDLWFNPSGVLQLTEVADPVTMAPEYTFQVGAQSNLASLGRSVHDSRIRNHIVVHGKTPDEVPIWATASNTNPDSPTSVPNLGQRTEIIESGFVTDAAQALNYAHRVLKTYSLESFEISLDTLIAPWLDVGVVVEIIDPDAAVGDPTEYLLTDLSFDLKLDPLSGSAKRIIPISTLT